MYAMKSAATISPGRIPAAKSRPIEVSVNAPKIRNDRLGGISSPSVPPPARLPTTMSLSYPRRVISG